MTGIQAAGGALQSVGDTWVANGNYIANNPGDAAYSTLSLIADTLMYFPDMALDSLGLGTGAVQRQDARINGAIDGVVDSANRTSEAFQAGDAKAFGSGMMGVAMAVAPKFKGAPRVWSNKARLKDAGLPSLGKIRFVPPKGYNASNPLRRGPSSGFMDRFGNEWVKGPSRTKGQSFEWDVQLSRTGKSKMGWASRDGSHLNVSLDGRITHK